MVSATRHQHTLMAVGVCMLANVPVLLWGPPGNGKTSSVERIGEVLRMHVETVIASIYSPSEFAGQPFINDEDQSMALYPPAWAKRLKAAAEVTGSPGAIAFYDEISTAPESVQAALLRPILQGWVGDLELPKNVRTIAAANPPDQAAGGWDLTPPAANRFVHLDWVLPADVIRDGFSGHWPDVEIPVLPRGGAKDHLAAARRMIGAFIGSRPQLATAVPDSATDAGRAWPSPRSWETFAKVYAVATAAALPSGVVDLLAEGCVGAAAAREVLAYIDNLDLPDPETLLRDPASWTPDPNRSDISYAVCSALLAALQDRVDGDRWANAGRVLANIAAAGHADIAVVQGNRWLLSRPEGTMPPVEVSTQLAPILRQMHLLVS